MTAPLTYVADPSVKECDGMFQIDFVSGDHPLPMVMTVHSLQMLVRRANRTLDVFHEKQSQTVVAFTAGGRRKRS